MSISRCTRLALAVTLAALIAGCQALNPTALHERSFQPSNNPVTVDSVTRNDKLVEIAKTQHPHILATYGGEYSDPRLERMIAKVVGRLIAVSKNPNQTYRITILNSPNVNAFALPGGYLYVTRGLLSLVNDSAELAAVIAHEMGHITANHSVQRQQKEAEEVLATKVVTDVLSESQTAKAALIRGKLRLAQFSRNQELEADGIGIKMSGQAGYDPFAAGRFLQSMATYYDLSSVNGTTDASLDFLASHPNTPQRIDLAQRHARQFGTQGIGKRDRDSFLAGIDCLLFGNTPDEGYVRGTTFLHPTLSISFSVPQGFVIDNTEDAVVATGPGNIAIRFDGVTIDNRLSLPDYIRSGWVVGLDSTTVRTKMINGNEAALAHASTEGWQFDIVVIRVGVHVYRLLTASSTTNTDLDNIVSSVSSSFKVMTTAEKAALKPLRIRVITVQPGQNIESLAASMVGMDRKLDLFRVLNGFGLGATVSVSDKVKIVTDR